VQHCCQPLLLFVGVHSGDSDDFGSNACIATFRIALCLDPVHNHSACRVRQRRYVGEKFFLVLGRGSRECQLEFNTARLADAVFYERGHLLRDELPNLNAS